MKKRIKYWMIMITGILLWTSCFEDKGNYDYVDLGDMTIRGVITDRWYEAFAFSDTLKIPVEVNSTRYLQGEQPYTYAWKLIGLNWETMDGDIPLDYTLSREKDLDIVLRLKAGEYLGFLLVTDTLLGLQEKVDFYVRLKTQTSEGWMILCEQDGESRLDWIVPTSDTTERISRDIWAASDFRLGKPYSIASAYSLQGSNRYVFAERGTYNIDREDAHVGEDNDVKWNFGDVPDAVHGLATEIAYQRNNRMDMLVTQDKNLYVRNPFSTGAIYGFPVNKTSDGARFDVAPWFGHSYGFSEASVIIYDETNRRFMEFKDDNKTIPQLLSFAGGRVDFPVETGRDMVYMNWTKDGYTFAVLEDPADHELYIYGIKVESKGSNYRHYYMRLNCPDNNKIMQYAFHSVYRYLFYSTDKGEVYQFDMTQPDTPAEKILSFPGENITALKINKLVGWIAYQPWERQRENQLVVGSYRINGNEKECGIMRIYDVPALMGPLVLKHEYKELGKIVDIVYRERGK